MSALSGFKHIFPAPKYMTLPNVGVDISDTSLKYMQFRRRHSRDTNLELHQYGDIDVPDGVVERGVVKDVAGLTEALQQVRAVSGTEYVRVSLPEERAYLFETTIDYDTPFKEIRGLLEFKLEENVPLSPRDAYFDYDIVERTGDKDDLLISVAVYAKDTINNYYTACTEAGFMPLSFEIEAQALTRAVAGEDDTDAHMIVDFGKTRTGIGIVYHGTLMYTSTIDIGGNDLSRAMSEKVGNLSEKEFSAIKNTKGLLNTKDNEAYEPLVTAISDIQKELETRIHYWNTRAAKNDERDISRIILCGGSSNLAGLPEYLSEHLSIKTQRADVWKNAFSLDAFVPPIDRRHSYGYATAIGLALKDFVSYD